MQAIGLYPYVDEAITELQDKLTLWINRRPNEYTQLKPWILGRTQITVRD